MILPPFRTLSALVVAASLCGCAVSPPMYRWGKYDTLLYQSYKSPDKAGQMRTTLEAHVRKLEAANLRVAPGLYAEVGTLYLQSDDIATARRFYVKERDAWPESRVLMDALIANIDSKRSKPEVQS